MFGLLINNSCPGIHSTTDLRNDFNLLFTDWGGAIVWKVAAWYPEVVEKLVVMAGPHPKLFLKNMDAAQKKKCAPPF